MITPIKHVTSYREEGGSAFVTADDYMLKFRPPIPRSIAEGLTHAHYLMDRCRRGLPPCGCPGSSDVVLPATYGGNQAPFPTDWWRWSDQDQVWRIVHG